MNNLKTLLLFFIVNFSCIPFIYAQNDVIPLNTILERKAKLTHNHPTEKVYLHFDKPYYAVGDTIWFKAYVTVDQHIPSPLSKIVYVELINQKDSIVSSLKLMANQGAADGHIILGYPDFKEGNYHVRAFTKWMLNSDAAYFFSKNIPVGNALNKNLQTYINFKSVNSEKEEQVNTQIIFKDENGKPIPNSKVSWEVIADDEKIDRGKETTDAKGAINFKFTSPKKVDLAHGKLLTTLETNDKRTLNTTFPLKKAVVDDDLQFFPEGGDLIDGLMSKVAFKALQANGLGIGVRGTIVDKAGKEIASFTDQHLGMGVLSFQVQKGEGYTAKAIFADGSQKNIPLSKVKEEGVNLSAVQSGEDIFIRIATNAAYLAKNPNQHFYLIAQNGGVAYYAAQGDLGSEVYSAKIPQNKFPTGILQITLLASNGLPLSERLVFIQRKEDLKVNIKTDLPVYNGRQKVKMNINSTQGLEKTNGNFSVSVINLSKVPVDEEKETTIKSYLLLSSDLTGYLEQPNYYFVKTDDKKRSDLDVLMLTQGYRRFLYKDIAANKEPVITVLPEQGIDISGTIRRSSGLPLAKGSLLFQIPNKHYSITGTTDQDGKFKFSNLVFQDSSEVVINARNNINSKDLRINVDGEAYPSVYSNINAPSDELNLDSTLNTYLRNNKIEHNSALLLNEVVVKSTAIKKPSHTDYSSLVGLSALADKTTSSQQLGGCPLLVNCLSGAGLTYIDNTLYLTKTYNQGLKVPIEIYANDMPVDVNYLNSINAKDIESLEVFNNDGLSGINARTGTSGILVINMKVVKKVSMSKEQFKELFPPNNVLTFKPKGYAAEKQFYLPKYSGPLNTLQRRDIRTTIYWNPNVNTDKEGNASLEYFNGDEKGTYRVVVEGINSNGDLGRGVYTYQIK